MRKEQGVSSHNINFEYNSLGQLIQQNLASGENTKTTQYQWDSFGNPVSQTVQSNIGVVNTKDTGEQATKHNAGNNDHTDASTSIDLTRATHSEYSDSSETTVASDLSDNDDVITDITDADRLTHFGDSDFHYDEFGNQIRETGKGIKTRREYNAFNQLSCFNNNGTLTQYDYDPLGRRIAKHTEQGKIDYIWDNDQLIGEYQHGEYTWYINLPNQFHPVALIKQGEVYYYHLDQLNTPRFVTNNKAEVVWENQADVYGYEESEVSNTNSFTQPIRFQGQYLDEESGLNYNRYRYYSPKQQRFINQDPIGLVGGINHYQYAPNPVNWVDPMGLLCAEGEKRLKNKLDSLVGNGFDQETVDAIFNIAIACTPIDNKDISTIDYPPEGGVYRKKHEYSFENILPEENKITITREMPSGKRISQTVSIKDFAQQHIDNNEKVANIHWGKILEKEHGVAKPSPEEMENAHAHHIVFKEGSGKQKEWVLKSKAILEKHEIDWLKGPENLVWAPNIEGLHTEEMAKLVYEELAEADKTKPPKTKKAVINTLRDMGRIAAEHTRGKVYP